MTIIQFCNFINFTGLYSEKSKCKIWYEFQPFAKLLNCDNFSSGRWKQSNWQKLPTTMSQIETTFYLYPGHEGIYLHNYFCMMTSLPTVDKAEGTIYY